MRLRRRRTWPGTHLCVKIDPYVLLVSLKGTPTKRRSTILRDTHLGAVFEVRYGQRKAAIFSSFSILRQPVLPAIASVWVSQSWAIPTALIVSNL